MKAIAENVTVQQEVVPTAKKSKFKRKLITTAIIVVLVLLMVGAACLSGLIWGKQASKDEIATLENEIDDLKEMIDKLKETPIVVNPVNPEIVLETLYSEIDEIGELATVEYLFTNSSRFSDSRQIKEWNIPFTEKSFTLRWDGIIKAGVKLNSISIKFAPNEKKIIVSIPAAEILSYQIDSDSVELLDEKNNIFNKISVEDKIKFDASTEAAMKERAIENGLLEKAQNNAEDILRRLLQANPSIGTTYTIEFIVATK